MGGSSGTDIKGGEETRLDDIDKEGFLSIRTGGGYEDTASQTLGILSTSFRR